MISKWSDKTAKTLVIKKNTRSVEEPSQSRRCTDDVSTN
jgi:hypothetical protein